MTSLALLLTLLVVTGHFLDFLVGKRGDRLIKNRIVDIYIKLNEGDWKKYCCILQKQ